MIALVALLLFSFAPVQSNDRIKQTWNGPDAPVIRKLFEDDASPSRTTQGNSAAVKFTPTRDSGVIKTLSDALGNTAEERAALAEAFTQFKQGYEAEAAKAGKENNLAVTMTFFIVANVVAYQQTEMPSDADTVEILDAPRFGCRRRKGNVDWLTN